MCNDAEPVLVRTFDVCLTRLRQHTGYSEHLHKIHPTQNVSKNMYDTMYVSVRNPGQKTSLEKQRLIGIDHIEWRYSRKEKLLLHVSLNNDYFIKL